MNRTELITQILKLTQHKRSVNPEIVTGLQRLLDKYEQTLNTMDDPQNPDQEAGERPERPDEEGG